MNTSVDYKKLAQHLQDQLDPVETVQHQLWADVFGAEYDHSKEYQSVLTLEPFVVEGMIRADAVEFMAQDELKDPYKKLQDFMKRFAIDLDMNPEKGEKIIEYINRLTGAGTQKFMMMNKGSVE